MPEELKKRNIFYLTFLKTQLKNSDLEAHRKEIGEVTNIISEIKTL